MHFYLFVSAYKFVLSSVRALVCAYLLKWFCVAVGNTYVFAFHFLVHCGQRLAHWSSARQDALLHGEFSVFCIAAGAIVHSSA
jgi:hypothetical protein